MRSQNGDRTNGFFELVIFFEPERLRSTSPDVLDPTESSRYYAVYELDKHSRSESFVSAGGALIKNRLFFYGIYQGQQIEKDNYRGSEVVHREISNDPFWGGKLDWLVGDWHSFELTAFSDQKATNRAIFPWDEFTHEMGSKIGDTTFNRGGRNYILSYSGRFTQPVVARDSHWTREVRSHHQFFLRRYVSLCV